MESLPLVHPQIRVLLGGIGWPSGLLEIGSWARREDLAAVRIVPVGRAGAEPDDQLEPADTAAARSLVGPAFAAALDAFWPHVVGFRLEGGRFDEVCSYIRAVRLLCPPGSPRAVEIVLGGPTATSHPVDVLSASAADYVFAGEAEETFNRFLRLARTPHSRDCLPEIPGLAYRYGGRAHVNTLPRDGYGRSVLDADQTLCGVRRRCLANLARPVTDAAVIAANRLDWSLLCDFEDRTFDALYFTAGRGCPGACTFCARLHGQEVRVKPAAQLLEEVAAADQCVRAGALGVGRWPLFAHTSDPLLKHKQVAWAAVYDEDFLLDRRRAVEFFALWNESPLRERYRLSLQTNPRSLVDASGAPHAELFYWIDWLKPMVQLGAESFHPAVLARWRKRHTTTELETVLAALDRTRQDYTAFQLLTDFDTTPAELVESLRLLALAAFRHRRMRIAASPLTIPLYDAEIRADLEHRGRIAHARINRFTDYEEPQPGWMDPLVVELADAADAELAAALEPARRDAAILGALAAVAARLCARAAAAGISGARPPHGLAALADRAQAAADGARHAHSAALFAD